MTRRWAVHKKSLRGRMKVCVSFHLPECCGCSDCCAGRICECDSVALTELEWRGSWLMADLSCHFAILIRWCLQFTCSSQDLIDLLSFGCCFLCSNTTQQKFCRFLDFLNLRYQNDALIHRGLKCEELLGVRVQLKDMFWDQTCDLLGEISKEPLHHLQQNASFNLIYDFQMP